MRRLWQRCALAMLSLAQACGSGSNQGVAPVEESMKGIEAFRNRTIYTSLDPRTLASIPDDRLEQAVVDYVFSKLENHYDQERQIVNGLSEGARALYLTWIVEGEVNNGGFNQYYWNTEDRFAADAVTAFEFFGADQYATLMREANAVHAAEAEAISKYKERGTREAFSESYEASKLEPLDKRFYQLGNSLSALRIAKIRELPEQFSGN